MPAYLRGLEAAVVIGVIAATAGTPCAARAFDPGPTPTPALSAERETSVEAVLAEALTQKREAAAKLGKPFLLEPGADHGFVHEILVRDSFNAENNAAGLRARIPADPVAKADLEIINRAGVVVSRWQLKDLLNPENLSAFIDRLRLDYYDGIDAFVLTPQSLAALRRVAEDRQIDISRFPLLQSPISGLTTRRISLAQKFMTVTQDAERINVSLPPGTPATKLVEEARDALRGGKVDNEALAALRQHAEARARTLAIAAAKTAGAVESTASATRSGVGTLRTWAARTVRRVPYIGPIISGVGIATAVATADDPIVTVLAHEGVGIAAGTGGGALGGAAAGAAAGLVCGPAAPVCSTGLAIGGAIIGGVGGGFAGDEAFAWVMAER